MVWTKTFPGVSHMLPCSVVLLTAGSKEKKDAMTATCMFISEDPPLFVVSISKHLLSHDLIEQTGEFVLNVASRDQVKLARQLGASHGTKIDKFKKFGIVTEDASVVSAPLVKGAAANIECRALTSFPASNYIVYLAEVVSFKVDDKTVPVAWYMDKYYALEKEVK
jgi:flavin reductase (DIM6/NTAB) family NADH-FMN oxidoreductase RutF